MLDTGNMLITIVTSTITLLIGIYLNRIFENRPQLITHFGHISSAKAKDNAGNYLDVFTHSVVIRNNGQKPAVNVRLGHNPLPSDNNHSSYINLNNIINIYPPTEFKVAGNAKEGQEIIIERILPKEEISITYLYFPPILFNQINTYVKSDEGIAKRVNVLLQPQYPLWVINIIRFLILIGFITTIFILYKVLNTLSLSFP